MQNQSQNGTTEGDLRRFTQIPAAALELSSSGIRLILRQIPTPAEPFFRLPLQFHPSVQANGLERIPMTR